jgi:hypothetical protein
VDGQNAIRLVWVVIGFEVSSMLFRRRATRRFLDILEQSLSPRQIDQLLKEPGDWTTLRDGEIEYMLVAVRGEPAALAAQRMGVAVEVAMRHGASVEELLSGLVVLLLKAPSPIFERTVDARAMFEDLRVSLGDDVKAVRRAEPGSFGYIGSQQRGTVSIIVPGFLEALMALGRLEYGRID